MTQAERALGKWVFPGQKMCYLVMSEKQDPENREEALTSNRPASTSRRNTQEESRDFPGAYNGFRGQAAENPRLSSYMFPRAGEPWRHQSP